MAKGMSPGLEPATAVAAGVATSTAGGADLAPVSLLEVARHRARGAAPVGDAVRLLLRHLRDGPTTGWLGQRLEHGVVAEAGRAAGPERDATYEGARTGHHPRPPADRLRARVEERQDTAIARPATLRRQVVERREQ